MLGFKLGELREMLGAIRNWGRRSEIDDARLPDKILGYIVFKNILSISVLELLLTLVG